MEAAMKGWQRRRMKEDILGMSLLELASVCTTITRRLYMISLYDNHVPNGHREAAAKLLEMVKSTVEETFKDNPKELMAYREANSSMEEGARKLGVGSLAWKILEYGIPSDEMVAFIARPEHRHLLDDFFPTLGRELAEQVRRKVEHHALSISIRRG
jgi:hypothetical protein